MSRSYDFGEHEGLQYFVMRYVSGGTFRDRIKAGRPSLRTVADVLERVADALEAAHAKALVHRDVKPANILFDERDAAYLSDFGVVKHNGAVDETGTLLLGTPLYLSPEQAQSAELDGRSDVYSLGVVAYHAIASRPPFSGNTPMAVAMAHVMEEPPPIRSLVPDLPKVADGVFARVLAKDPNDRYPTAGEFARDIRDIASGRWYLVKLTSTARSFDTKAPPPQPTSRRSKTGDTVEFFAGGRPFEAPARRPRRSEPEDVGCDTVNLTETEHDGSRVDNPDDEA